jgi:hypothetical protein
MSNCMSAKSRLEFRGSPITRDHLTEPTRRLIRARLHDAFVYRPLAFAEPAESIKLAQRGLQVRPGETVAGITSSGDILLSLLASRPARIYGFDANPTQTALARLKCALCASASLDHSTAFLGLTPESRRGRLQTWAELRIQLGSDAPILEKYDIGQGLLNCGTTRKLFRLMTLGLRMCLGSARYGWLVGPSSTATSRVSLLNELRQRTIYRFFLRPMLQMGRRVFQHFLYPPALCLNSDHPQRAMSDILASYSRLFEVGFWENPVFERFLTGRIPQEQIRSVYSPDTWAAIKERIDDIRFETASIQEALPRLGAQSVDAFYLSNAPDYLRPDDLRKLSQALSHTARPGARVFYLSLDSQCPFVRSSVGIAFDRSEHLEHKLKHADPVGLYRYVGVRTRA